MSKSKRSEAITRNEALLSEHLEKQGVFMDYIDITQYPTLMAALGRNRALPNYEYISKR